MHRICVFFGDPVSEMVQDTPIVRSQYEVDRDVAHNDEKIDNKLDCFQSHYGSILLKLEEEHSISRYPTYL